MITITITIVGARGIRPGSQQEPGRTITAGPSRGAVRVTRATQNPPTKGPTMDRDAADETSHGTAEGAQDTSEVDASVDRWLSTFGAPDARPAHLLCDRHDPAAPAFRLLDGDLVEQVLTYGELADASARVASALAARGVSAGDRVGVLMAKRYEYVVSAMALWRLGATLVPLFTAFATGAIEVRVEGSGARMVVTEASQRAKVDPLGDVEVVDVDSEFAQLLEHAPLAEAAVVGGEGLLAMLFTSGTTGKPKGVGIPVRALAAFTSYMHFGLDVAPDDVFWNAADPGWAYGLYYGVLGPLVTGRPNLLLNSAFDAGTTREVFERFGVTNFAGAPTMYRAMSRDPAFTGFSLRRASSAGEPLTPDVLSWAEGNLGVEVRDHYGQTEHGMMIVNAWHEALRRPVRAGSMGTAMPGFAAGVVEGQIALEVARSPAMFFTGYVDDEQTSTERFTPDRDWYLSGDVGGVDEDGHFYFTSRDDDVILASGYRIGPFDVESVLLAHAAVADVAVVGKPDDQRGEVVTAYVVLATGYAASEQLSHELQQLVKESYSAHAYPRVVHVVDALPRTPSGKVQRFVLRELRD